MVKQGTVQWPRKCYEFFPLGTLLGFYLLYSRSQLKEGIIFYLFSSFYLLFGLILFSVGLVFTIKYLLYEDLYLRFVLTRIIRSNALYDKSSSDGSSQIINSIQFRYRITEKNLIIDVYPRGSGLVKKCGELDAILSSGLERQLLSKSYSIKYFRYLFEVEKEKRLLLDANFCIQKKKSDQIQISTNIFWNIDKCPHGLVTGKTGSGKTYFLEYLVLAFQASGATVYVIDPKRSDLYSLKSIVPDTMSHQFACSQNNIARILREVTAIMEIRYFHYLACTFGKTYRDFGMEPEIIIFDEFAAFMSAADKTVAKEVMSSLKTIILMGRQAGVFVIIGTQKPMADVLSTDIRDQLSFRVAFGSMTPDAYVMSLNDESRDLPALAGVGTGYLLIDGQEWLLPRPFEAPLFKDSFNYQEQYAHLLEGTRL